MTWDIETTIPKCAAKAVNYVYDHFAEPEVGRLKMSDEMEYIIIITAMCLVGVIVIILVSFTVAVSTEVSGKSTEEKIMTIAAVPFMPTPDYPLTILELKIQTYCS